MEGVLTIDMDVMGKNLGKHIVTLGRLCMANLGLSSPVVSSSMGKEQ